MTWVERLMDSRLEEKTNRAAKRASWDELGRVGTRQTGSVAASSRKMAGEVDVGPVDRVDLDVLDRLLWTRKAKRTETHRWNSQSTTEPQRQRKPNQTKPNQKKRKRKEKKDGRAPRRPIRARRRPPVPGGSPVWPPARSPAGWWPPSFSRCSVPAWNATFFIFYLVWQHCIRFYRVLLGFTGFYWVFPSLTRFY